MLLAASRQRIHAGIARLSQSAVVWSWVFNALRLASGLLLLPLLLRVLSESDLGMYYAFLNLITVVPMIDATVSLNLGRYVGYAMGGAETLQPVGLAAAGANKPPNYALVWSLLRASRRLYVLLGLGTFLLLGMVGTHIVGLRIEDTSMPQRTWTAWGLLLVATAFDVSAGGWNVFLRSMNYVVASARLAVLCYATRLLLAVTLLLAGGGLIGVAAAWLSSSALMLGLSRRECLQVLAGQPQSPGALDFRALLATLWPNTWRVGLQLLSFYLVTVSLMYFALHYLGDLAVYAQYGLSLQVMTIANGMASVWTQVKWPQVIQLRARGDQRGVRQILWPRIVLQTASFLAMAAFILWAGPPLLAVVAPDKSLLPAFWLRLLALNTLLEMHFSFWTVLLSTENRIPSLWPAVLTNTCVIGLAFWLVTHSTLGVGALVLPPLVLGTLFNYWYWPWAGARSLRDRAPAVGS
jgi:O-antigen/teichoic acid export membrane protein